MFTTKEVAVGVGVPVSFSAVAIASVHYFVATPDVGDLLSFIGALFGVAGAIGGAIYVEERRRRAIAASEQQPVLDAIRDLREALQELREQETLGSLNYDQVEHAESILSRIHQFFPPRTPLLLRHRDALEASLSRLVKVFSDAAHEGSYYRQRPLGEGLLNAVTAADVTALQLANAYRTSL